MAILDKLSAGAAIQSVPGIKMQSGLLLPVTNLHHLSSEIIPDLYFSTGI
jgi:hypothetical protein